MPEFNKSWLELTEEERKEYRDKSNENGAIELIQILWDYMRMNQRLEKSDCIIVLGTIDVSVVDVAVDLYFKGYANKIIFSGGVGKITSKFWKETEAEKFAKRAMELGVPKNNIYIENESTNTGDNFRFTKRLIEKEKLDIDPLRKI